MKLGFIVLAAAQAADPCHEKSEKRLGKMTTAFDTWADTYATANRADKLKTRIGNIADKMLSHYNEHNAEICNEGARMGDEEPE